MDNSSRSERSRKAAIQAALTIIARDGPGQLTFDAISRESGISKGGLMHQFPSKGALMKGLLEHQIEYFGRFSGDFYAAAKATNSEATLAASIATTRLAISDTHSVAFAILAALVEDPSLLSASRDRDAEAVQAIKAEAADPDLSLLRWLAARGLVMTALFGLCPLSQKERDRLFDRLLDDSRWRSVPAAKSRRPARPTTDRSKRAERRR